MDELCVELAANGWLAWDLEYRTDGGDGGWPETFDDVAAGSTTWPLWTRPGV